LVKIILIVSPIKLVRKGLGKDCPVIVKVSSIASAFIDMIPPSLVAPAIFDASLAASSSKFTFSKGTSTPSIYIGTDVSKFTLDTILSFSFGASHL